MTELLQYTFFRYALIAVVLAAIVGALMGTYVVARRMVLLTGGITHACFGGLGLAIFMGWNPVITATGFAAASALTVEWLSGRGGVRHDTAIGVVWAFGMALGTILIFLTPDYTGDLSTFLFGNILMVRPADLIALGAFLAVAATFIGLYYRQIVAAAFDPEFARTIGLHAARFNGTMTLLVSICVVLCIRITGIMLLLSLFTLPAMIAERFAHRLAPMMAVAAAVSLLCSLGGLALSVWLGVPAGSTIVLTLVATYAATALARPNAGR